MTIKDLSIKELKKLTQDQNLLEFNRDIKEGHVDKMLRSIEQCGILRLPVIGDVSKFDKRGTVIIDGQHLCTAMVLLDPNNEKAKNKIPCIFKVYESKAEVIADIAKVNNTQKTWKDADYLAAWTSFGKDNVDYYWNYHELTQIYNRFEGIPIGFLVDLFAKSKDAFKEGKLEFRDSQFSMKVLQIAHKLKQNHGKPAHTLHGLSKWAIKRKFIDKRDIDFVKLESRLMDAVRHNKDKNCNGRDDFSEFIEDIYTKL
jgi:hypothetical protein